MSESGAYGRRLADHLHSETSRALVSRTLRKDVVGFTEIRSDHPTHAVSGPIPREDALLIALQHTLYDLKRDPRFLLDRPFHSVHFYFTHESLNAIADAANAPPIDDLRYEPGSGVDDPIERALTAALYPALDRPDQANRMFVDWTMLALGCHIAQTYGGVETITERDGLAHW